MHVFDRRQLEQVGGLDPELERRFKQLLGTRQDALEESGAFRPPADVIMGGRELVIVIELAGISRDDVQLTTDTEELVVRGRRRDPVETDKERYLCLELATGAFERRVPLPPGLQMDSVAAGYRDGFLIIRILRQEGGSVDWQGREER